MVYGTYLDIATQLQLMAHNGTILVKPMGTLSLNVLFHIKTLILHTNTLIPHGVVYATYRVLMPYGTCLLKQMGTLPLNGLFHIVWTDVE